MRGREVFYPIGFDDNGLPTERRVQNYYGVRCDPVAALRRRPTRRATPARRRRPRTRSRSRGATSSSFASALTARGREGLRGALAPARALRRLGPYLHDDRRPRSRGRATWLPAQPGARRGLPGRGADAVGRDLPHGGRAGRARGPRACRRVPPDRVRAHRRQRPGQDRDHPPRAARRPASRSSPIPTTSATSRCSVRRSARRCSASRCRSSRTTSPRPTRAPASR